MPRNGEKVHRRLQGAAMELFLEHGYEQTTAASIAARAGVTERTFYRHFPDKREILFDGATALQATLEHVIANAPPEAGPLHVLWNAFSAVETLFEENRQFAALRQQVIAAAPALRERELSKLSSLVTALAIALTKRGTDDRLARLAAHAAMASFDQALISWSENPERSLRHHLADGFRDLQSLSAGVVLDRE